MCYEKWREKRNKFLLGCDLIAKKELIFRYCKYENDGKFRHKNFKLKINKKKQNRTEYLR